MAVQKFLNPNYSEGGSEPKYITLHSIVNPAKSEIYVGESEPSVSTYKLWVDTANNAIKYSNGTSWTELEGRGS